MVQHRRDSWRSGVIDSALWRARWAALLCALLAVGIMQARAGSFQVNPIRIDLGKSAPNAVITVRNDGEDAIVVQASVVAWTQDGGRDVYAETKEALITPPIMTIQPGSEQVLRVGLRRGPDVLNELAYRVFLQEVPPPPKPGFNGLQVALRVGLPVFVAPAAPVARRLEWSATIGPNAVIKLNAYNTGNGHLQVSDFELRLPGESEPVARESSLSYILPGQRRQWTLPTQNDRVKSAGEVRLKAYTDAGEIETAVKIEP